MRKIILKTFAWILFTGLSTATITGSPVLLIVLDGFRYDYLGTYATPNLDKIWKTEGVLVPSLQPEFPASRLPFLASLLTGRHADKHEVISEELYNNDNQEMLFSNQSEFWAKTRELKTIWDLEKSSRVCNCWPFSQFLIDEDRIISQSTNETEISSTEKTTNVEKTESSTVEKTSNETSSKTDKSATDNEMKPIWTTCVKDSIKLLVEGKSKFVALYLEEPGRTAEIFGPDADEVGAEVAKVDGMIGALVAGLAEAHLDDKVNVVVTSTPGFSGVRPDRLIDLPTGETKTSNSTYLAFGQSPVLNIKPNPGKDLEVLVMLRKSHATKLNYDVFITAEFPEDLHYRQASSPVVQPIVLLAHEGYAFSQDFAQKMKSLNEIGNRTEGLTNTYGCSGYNNSLPNMQTFLIGRGPDFALPTGTNQLSKPDDSTKIEQTTTVRVVDVFALLCHLLDIDLPKEIDADLSRISHLLKVTNTTDNTTTLEKVEDFLTYLLEPKNLPITISVGVGALLLLIILCCCVICLARRRRKTLKSTAGYRYSQVKNNRRYSPQDDPDNSVQFSAVDEADALQEQSLLAASASEDA